MARSISDDLEHYYEQVYEAEEAKWYAIGYEIGYAVGLYTGLYMNRFIKKQLEEKNSYDKIIKDLQDIFSVDEDLAKEYLDSYIR